MAATGRGTTRTHARPPILISKEQAKDGAGKMAARAMAEATKADGAKALAAKEKEKEKEEREKGTRAGCMSST